MTNPFQAYIRGLPESPSITEINIRSGPSRDYEPPVFKAPVGWSNLAVLEVRPDEKGAGWQGKTYQWFKLQFPNGQTGWARDDLLEVVGDGRPFGYGVINVQTFAFVLTRSVSVTPTAATVPSAPAAPPATPATPAPAVNATVSTPATPAPSVNVTVTVPGTVPAAPPTAPVTTGPAMVIPIVQQSAPTRTGPGITNPRTGIFLERRGRYPLLDVQREMAGQNYRWFKVSAHGQQVWVREDLVTYEGDTSAFNLPTDLYPAPMNEKYWWVRGYNMPPNKDNSLVDHDGWDLGAATGEPIRCGPNGGLVVKSFECVRCTPDRPSSKMHGFDIGAPAVVNDPGWGFGYGHYVIVGYTNDQLPPSTRSLLASKGFPGGAIFVMYAHLATRSVTEGQKLVGGQQIGTCGNSGNSEATHLHLEIRASLSPVFSQWFNIRSGVMDAVALFRR